MKTESSPAARAIAVLQFLVQYVDAQGYPPTYREIADGIGLTSTCLVKPRLVELEAYGLINRGAKGWARAISITPTGRKFMEGEQ